MMSSKVNIPRVLLGATASGGGKTTVTCGILSALKKKGKSICSFKCGPDYIDPMFHTKVIGIPSRNLDLFFNDPDTIKYLMARNTKSMDIAIMEGVMGYYDGVGGITSKAGAYDLAKTTETPAILIIDCKGKSLSIVAEIKGFLEFKEDSQIKGVILNRISPMLYNAVKTQIEQELPIKVYGYMPILPEASLESRHLGLVTADEISNLESIIDALGEQASKTVDIEGIMDLAKDADSLKYDFKGVEKIWDNEEPLKLAVAKDKAFCFYYEDNLQLLQDLGVSVEFFSPLNNDPLPEGASGLIIGGGYPELYLPELERAITSKQTICRSIASGIPTLAECGGFMYLHEKIEDREGNVYAGLGVIPDSLAYYTGKLGRFGYINVSMNEDTMPGHAGTEFKAHEFHYWDSTRCGTSCHGSKPVGKRNWDCIVSKDNIFAGFPHIHYYSNMEMAKNFVKAMIEYKKNLLK